MTTNTEEVWRLAEYVEGDGATLLAGNLSLLESVGRGEVQPTLRWYRYARPCVVLGYGQKISAVDAAACAARGVAVLRRPAGGSAVLADRGLLGLAIALRLPHPLASADLTESYRWLGETLAAALAHLGVPSRLVSIDEARADTAQVRAAAAGMDSVRGLACFGSFSPYEVAVGVQKVVGLAQVRRRQAVLYQVGILLRSATDLLAEVLSCPPAERALLAQALRERTTDLRSLLGREVEPDEVIALVHAELARRWGVALGPAPLTATELAETAAAVPRVIHLASTGPASQATASSL